MASWLKRLFGKSSPPSGPLGRGWDVLWGLLRRQDSWEDMTLEEQERAYRNHELVYACVTKIANSIASVPLLVYQQRIDEDEEVLRHPMSAIMARPNQLYTRASLQKYVTMRLLLTGAAYVWKWRDKAGRLAQLWPLPTSWVTPIPGKMQEGQPIIAGYLVKQGRDKITVEAKDMLYIYFPDPQSIYSGLAPLTAAARGYRLDSEQGNYLIEMIQNVAVPGTVVWAKEGAGMETREHIRSFVHDKAGRGARGGTLVLEGDGKIEQPTPLADLDWPGFAMMTETRICAAFGVPPIIAGARAGIEKSSYANYETAKRSFWEETIAPLAGMLDEAYSLGILSGEDEPDMYFKSDFSAVPAMQESTKDAYERAVKTYQGGLIDRDEGRREIGYSERNAPVFVKPVAQEFVDEQGRPLEGEFE